MEPQMDADERRFSKRNQLAERGTGVSYLRASAFICRKYH